MIRVTRKRLIVTAAVLLLLAGILVVTWRVCDWPPPRLILKYGFPPAGGPTGRTMEHRGNQFVEIGPGYRHLRRRFYTEKASWLGDLCGKVGLPIGTRGVRHPLFEDRWIEIHATYWISTQYLRGIGYRWEGSCISLKRPLPGKIRPPTSDELWFAAMTGALDISSRGMLVMIDGEGPAPPYKSEVMYLGSGWSEFDRKPATSDLCEPPWPGSPVVWIPSFCLWTE